MSDCKDLDPKSLPCDEVGKRCDPCEKVDNRSSVCSDPVEISTDGLYQTAKELRMQIGSVSDDPFDPAGFIRDEQLVRIIERHTTILKDLAQRALDEQCLEIQRRIDELLGLLSASIEKQDVESDQFLQNLKAQLEGAKKAQDIEVETLTEQFIRQGLPTDAASYFDEVQIPLEVSSRDNKVHYGIIEDDYISVPFDGFNRVTGYFADGTFNNYTIDPQTFEVAETTFFPVHRALVQGRYIYLTNNGNDLLRAVAMLTTEERVREYALKVAQAGAAVAELQERVDLYEANPFTESDALVAQYASDIQELCVDPPVITGTSLIATLVDDTNQRMIRDARQEVQFSSNATITTQSQSDEQ